MVLRGFFLPIKKAHGCLLLTPMSSKKPNNCNCTHSIPRTIKKAHGCLVTTHELCNYKVGAFYMKSKKAKKKDYMPLFLMIICAILYVKHWVEVNEFYHCLRPLEMRDWLSLARNSDVDEGCSLILASLRWLIWAMLRSGGYL